MFVMYIYFQIKILQEELENMKTRAELKLEDLVSQLKEKQKTIIVLQEQIRTIAYSTQKPIPSGVPTSKV